MFDTGNDYFYQRTKLEIHGIAERIHARPTKTAVEVSEASETRADLQETQLCRQRTLRCSGLPQGLFLLLWQVRDDRANLQ